MIRTLSWHLILHKVNFFLQMLLALLRLTILILTAPDGTRLFQITAGDLSAGRRPQQNILGEVSGRKPYAKGNVFAGSPASAWRLLVDNFILKHITKRTVTEARRQLHNQTFALTVEELELLSLSCMHEELQAKVITFAWYLD